MTQITSLPSASALASGDLFAIVQAGVTKKITSDLVLASGGNTGQILSKLSNNDYHTGWANSIQLEASNYVYTEALGVNADWAYGGVNNKVPLNSQEWSGIGGMTINVGTSIITVPVGLYWVYMNMALAAGAVSARLFLRNETAGSYEQAGPVNVATSSEGLSVSMFTLLNVTTTPKDYSFMIAVNSNARMGSLSSTIAGYGIATREVYAQCTFIKVG